MHLGHSAIQSTTSAAGEVVRSKFFNPRPINKPKPVTLQTLPPEIILKIFNFLSFDFACRNIRPVCRQLEELVSLYLSDGLRTAFAKHERLSNIVRRRMPRRESVRKNHTLSPILDVLSSIESRLGHLSITYNYDPSMLATCFVPGAVLDEAHKILLLVDSKIQNGEAIGRPIDVLRELRDMCSMAIEYFELNIRPMIDSRARAQLGFANAAGDVSSSSLSSMANENGNSSGFYSGQSGSGEGAVEILDRKVQKYHELLQSMRTAQMRSDLKLRDVLKKMQEQQKTIDDQRKLIIDMSHKIKKVKLLFGSKQHKHQSKQSPVGRTLSIDSYKKQQTLTDNKEKTAETSNSIDKAEVNPTPVNKVKKQANDRESKRIGSDNNDQKPNDSATNGSTTTSSLLERNSNSSSPSGNIASAESINDGSDASQSSNLSATIADLDDIEQMSSAETSTRSSKRILLSRVAKVTQTCPYTTRRRKNAKRKQQQNLKIVQKECISRVKNQIIPAKKKKTL